MNYKSIILVALIAGSFHAGAQQLAFPGAEGFGRFATGGRGGTVYHVTNLNDSGAGSFRDAVSQSGRTVVFDIGGVIKIKEKIQAASRITIAGQSAPGQGIVIYGNGISFSDSSIIRHIRFRGSIDMSRGACTVVADDVKDVIFDHVSIQWGRWDNLHIKGSSNLTLQNCIIGEAIDPQRFGALLEVPTNVTIHHCLWIDNQSRNPKGKAAIEFINNVVYNWGVTGFVGGHSSANHYQDLIGNYFIAGPNSNNSFIGQFSATDHLYHKGNYIDLNKDGILNGQPAPDSSFVKTGATMQKNPTQYTGKVTVDNATDAYYKVLKTAGASMHRDAVDTRLITYLQSLGKEGKIFKTEADAGGQGAIASGKLLTDTDKDGIPDVWENKNGLNRKDSSDANKLAANGYSNLENYLNSLAI